MNWVKHIVSFLVVMLFAAPSLFAQEVEMAEGLRSSGKIYVVVTVLVIIFIGLFIYLMSIDQKLNKLKKEFDQNQK